MLCSSLFGFLSKSKMDSNESNMDDIVSVFCVLMSSWLKHSSSFITIRERARAMLCGVHARTNRLFHFFLSKFDYEHTNLLRRFLVDRARIIMCHFNTVRQCVCLCVCGRCYRENCKQWFFVLLLFGLFNVCELVGAKHRSFVFYPIKVSRRLWMRKKRIYDWFFVRLCKIELCCFQINEWNLTLWERSSHA